MHLAMRGVYLFPKKSDTGFLKADGWSIVSLPGVDGYSLIELFTNDCGLSFDNLFYLYCDQIRVLMSASCGDFFDILEVFQ